MPSPFPGMDPYLEAHWGDIHSRLVIYASDQIRSQLPQELRARVEERVFVETEDGPTRVIYPDVRVVERPPEPSAGGTATQTVDTAAVADPLLIELQYEPITETYIEIRDVKNGGHVVTVIEFISVANKTPGKGRELYLQKQKELEIGKVNLVEIDLLRMGEHVISAPPYHVPPDYRTPYRISVRRMTRPLKAEVYRAPLQEPLPTIRVPLREEDKDAVLNLQLLINQCYENGDYSDIDYNRDPQPPLERTDAIWVDTMLREKAVRS